MDPAQILGLTVCTYWFCVGVMVMRVRRRAKKLRNILVPQIRSEQLMWLVWVPLILCWMALPFISAAQDPLRHPWVSIPAWARGLGALLVVRWAALVAGIICLLLSIVCWSHMGRDWRMGIDLSNKSRLILDGPFAWVRHPIYSLSIGLMVCSVMVVPTVSMLGLAVIHISLMNLKARNEERHMKNTHGDSYAEYCLRTGRFLPRLRRRSGSRLGDIAPSI